MATRCYAVTHISSPNTRTTCQILEVSNSSRTEISPQNVYSLSVVPFLALPPEIREVLKRIREIDGRERIGNLNVIRSLAQKEYKADAIRSAWDRAVERAGHAGCGYTIKSIRGKALTDAKRAGYDLTALQAVAAHSTPAMIRDYLKLLDVPTSNVRLRLPA
ncbi:integrase [Pandoraea horticolens]|uniref:Integrase n=1 Tax=Pandoraea horticolens TaxID=2508298 RepID=A0A5E4Y155_9BURK|nr:integrase [Pandoraea horticolens]